MPDEPPNVPAEQRVETGDAPVVPERISLRLPKLPHPLITRTLNVEEARNKNDYAYLHRTQEVDFSVSKKHLRLGLAILDRLFKALEAQGFEVAVDTPQYGRSGTVARKGRDSCAVRLDEIHEKVPHEATAKEKADQARYGTTPPKTDSVPTGNFTLSPGGKVDLRSEDAFVASLNKSIASIAEQVERARSTREERELRERREAERQRLIREEEERIKAFQKSAHALREYRLMIEYIEEVRRHKVIPVDQRREGQTLQEWLSWAEGQARRFHPLA